MGGVTQLRKESSSQEDGPYGTQSSSGDEDKAPWTSDNDEREGEDEEREDKVDKFKEEDEPK